MSKLIDLLVCLLLIIPVILFLSILSVLTLIFDGPPLLFIHKRLGKNGISFIPYKLKTYAPTKSSRDYLVVDHHRAEARVSILGRIYRDHGWDELPQIFNIVMGQMSFIGPRPLVENTYDDLKARYPKKVKLIEEWKRERLKVLPGLSGWHQVHLNDPDVIRYDQDYIKNPSIDKNIKIILGSIAIFIFGKTAFYGKKMPTSNQYEIYNHGMSFR